MTSKRKIGWQKYEDVLERQLRSPMMRIFLNQIIEAQQYSQADDNQEESYFDQEKGSNSKEEDLMLPILPISDEFAQDAALVSNFDCWVGHTNFNITKTIKDTLNSAEGVEILKINSRYRFFIGVGKMFDFTDVRTNIEEKLL